MNYCFNLSRATDAELSRAVRVCAVPDLSDGGCVDGSKLQLLLLLRDRTQASESRHDTSSEQPFKRTYVISADVPDELLRLVHGAGRRRKHGERLLVHLTDGHTCREEERSFVS